MYVLIIYIWMLQQELQELKELKEIAPGIAIFFIRVPPPITREITNNRSTSPIRNLQNTLEKHNLTNDLSPKKSYRTSNTSHSLNLFQQLLELGYLSLLPPSSPSDAGEEIYQLESELVENFDNFQNLANFTRHVLLNHLVKTTSLLNLIHTRCLQTFIMTAFDMARDMMITPRRLVFARDKETELYSSLMDIAIKKQDEIKRIIAETIADMREDLLDKAAEYDFIGEFHFSCLCFYILSYYKTKFKDESIFYGN